MDKLYHSTAESVSLQSGKNLAIFSPGGMYSPKDLDKPALNPDQQINQ